MAVRLRPYIPVKKQTPQRKYALREMKMIRPLCEECSGLGFGWWNNCPHDRFHRLKPVTVMSTRREVDPETGLVIKVESEKKVTHYAHVPNLVQVPLTMSINSGFGVEAAIGKGYKFPEDVRPTLNTGESDEDYDGYAPCCEYQNCYAPFPKVRAIHSGLEENRMIPESRRTGWYCSEMHAKLAKQKDSEGMIREVNDATRRREQLDAVTLP